MIRIIFFFCLLASRAFACDVIKDQLNPQLKKKLDDYEKFVTSLQNEKDPIKAINKRIKSQGLLLEAHINAKLVKNYPSSFHDDSITGARKLFLKNLKLPPGLHNDIIYEIPKIDAAKAIRSWQIPSNATFLGIRENEILYRAYLGTPCSKFHRDVILAISSDGKFRAIPDVKIPESKHLDVCPASKAIFRTSSYDSCVELKDVKSGKKRIIVFQSPMT